MQESMNEIKAYREKLKKEKKTQYIRRTLSETYTWLVSCFNYNFKSYRYRNSNFSRTNICILIRQWRRQQIFNCWAFYFYESFLLLVLHNLAFIWVISFSSLIARAMFPLIFSFPDMNAMVGFSFPKMWNEMENAALVP